MKQGVAILLGYLAGVAATVALALAVSETIGNGGILVLFDADSALMGLLKFVGIVAVTAAPGWVLARGLIAVTRQRGLWAFAIGGMGAAALALALVPGLPFSFGMIGMGAVAGSIAGLVERGLGT